MAKRKRHTEEFKREAVRLMETRDDRSIAEVAEGLGILTNRLYDWRRKYGDVTKAVRDERGETQEQELKRLRRVVARLNREREILVKAAVSSKGQCNTKYLRKCVHIESCEKDETQLLRQRITRSLAQVGARAISE